MKHYGKPFRRKINGRPSRHWYVIEYEHGEQRKRSTYQESRQLAVAVIRTWQRAAIDGIVEDRTFGEAVDMWLEEKRPHIAESYYRTYAIYRDRWLARWAGTSLGQITQRHLEIYLNELIAQGYAAVSANGERGALRMFFKWCHDHGWIRSNPAAGLRKFREPPRSITTIDPPQLGALLEAAEEESDCYYLFTMLLAYSGLRRGTVLALTWEDLDLDGGTWRIPAEKMKSKEPYEGRPIHPTLLAELRERKSNRIRAKLVNSIKYTTWQRLCRKAGLDGLTCHDLRRTFVTQCRREGLEMEITMWLSDHRDLRTVLRIYREIDTAEAAEGLARLFQRQ